MRRLLQRAIVVTCITLGCGVAEAISDTLALVRCELSVIQALIAFESQTVGLDKLSHSARSVLENPTNIIVIVGVDGTIRYRTAGTDPTLLSKNGQPSDFTVLQAALNGSLYKRLTPRGSCTLDVTSLVTALRGVEQRETLATFALTIDADPQLSKDMKEFVSRRFGTAIGQLSLSDRDAILTSTSMPALKRAYLSTLNSDWQRVNSMATAAVGDDTRVTLQIGTVLRESESRTFTELTFSDASPHPSVFVAEIAPNLLTFVKADTDALSLAKLNQADADILKMIENGMLDAFYGEVGNTSLKRVKSSELR